MSTNKIPVIDLQKLPHDHEKLVKACEDWGCFRQVDHSIDVELMAEMKAVVRSLLELPANIKERNVDVIAGSGYVAPSKANPLYEAETYKGILINSHTIDCIEILLLY